MRTRILLVMQGHAEDLHGPNGIHSVHALVEGDENLDRLIVAIRFFYDCTHLAGIAGIRRLLVVRVMGDGGKKEQKLSELIKIQAQWRVA